MPLLNDQVILDVTLWKGEARRRWTITKWAMGWSCRQVDGPSVIIYGCDTAEAMQTQRQAWEADIAALRADGWS
jgi:hypothetical protein